MGCAGCGFPAMDWAECCAFCGDPLRPAASRAREDDDCEYGELFVPLGVKVRPGPLAADDQRRIEETIRRYVREVAAKGWQPAAPTDWRSLRAAGYATRRDARSFGGGVTPYYESVRIPLRRAAGA